MTYDLGGRKTAMSDPDLGSELDWLAKRFDQGYYRTLLEKAWEEIAFAFAQART